jgi:hypothetical protein
VTEQSEIVRQFWPPMSSQVAATRAAGVERAERATLADKLAGRRQEAKMEKTRREAEETAKPRVRPCYLTTAPLIVILLKRRRPAAGNKVFVI